MPKILKTSVNQAILGVFSSFQSSIFFYFSPIFNFNFFRKFLFFNGKNHFFLLLAEILHSKLKIKTKRLLWFWKRKFWGILQKKSQKCVFFCPTAFGTKAFWALILARTFKKILAFFSFLLFHMFRLWILCNFFFVFLMIFNMHNGFRSLLWV